MTWWECVALAYLLTGATFALVNLVLRLRAGFVRQVRGQAEARGHSDSTVRIAVIIGLSFGLALDLVAWPLVLVGHYAGEDPPSTPPGAV